MAQEISVKGSLAFTKSSSVGELISGFLQPTMTGSNWRHGRQVIGTSEEALEMPADIGTPGWIMLINRDATNFVSMRRATGEGNFLKMLAGEFALFRMEAAAPYLIADSASCEVEYLVLEL
jgi:hypothetical protein